MIDTAAGELIVVGVAAQSPADPVMIRLQSLIALLDEQLQILLRRPFQSSRCFLDLHHRTFQFVKEELVGEGDEQALEL